MDINTVNISFKKDLLSKIDKVAAQESRSRSELIREAARMYIERRKKWQSIFTYAETKARKLKITEKDITAEIKKVRNQSSKR